MNFEEATYALINGKKVQPVGWGSNCFFYFTKNAIWHSRGKQIDSWRVYSGRTDWQIVKEPKRVADYWVPNPIAPNSAWKRTYEIGTQPADAVLIPNSEQEVAE